MGITFRPSTATRLRQNIQEEREFSIDLMLLSLLPERLRTQAIVYDYKIFKLYFTIVAGNTNYTLNVLLVPFTL